MHRPRLGYLDLLRVVAISAVVVGHWMLVDLFLVRGRLAGRDALGYVHWGGWLTLLLQVMPVFFLVGGYVNALSWSSGRERGATWAGWVRARATRLLWPTSVYVAVVATAVLAALRLGADRRTLAQGGWLLSLHLWFLPTYLLMAAVTPPMLAAHHRWGLRVPLVMALGAATVSLLTVRWQTPLVGFANYLLVWGSMHQWGFAWRDGSLGNPRRRPVALAVVGAVLLVVLVWWGPFPVDMIGTGRHPGNTSPPSVALLAFAAVQTGIVVAGEPWGRRLMARERWRRLVDRTTPLVVNVYLWHMLPVVAVGVTLYRSGVMPQPFVGTAAWWSFRPVWVLLLGVLLAGLVLLVTRLERPLRRFTGELPRPAPGACALVAVGLAVSGAALARLAIGGFAPSGRLAAPTMAAYAVGLALLWAAGGARSRQPSAATPA